MRVFLLIPTHTARLLDLCLAGLARQDVVADGVVLTCDADLEEIGETARRVWGRVRAASPRWGPLVYARRGHQGEPRLNQVRNNGLRALDAVHGLRDEDVVVIVDGDTMLAEDVIAGHRREFEAGADVVAASRINLDEDRTRTLSVDDLVAVDSGGAVRGPDRGYIMGLATAADMGELARRQRRLARQDWMRRFAPWLVKGHKPKILGGHHAVRVGLLRAVNGYDEVFRGDGTDDDDLARRMYMVRPRVRVACRASALVAFHCHHPTRRPWRPTGAPDHARFARVLETPVAEHGWRTPREQPEPVVSVVE